MYSIMFNLTNTKTRENELETLMEMVVMASGDDGGGVPSPPLAWVSQCC